MHVLRFARNAVYSLVNSLFVHLGQGGIVSPLPRRTFVWQFVQSYVPLPGAIPVL